MITVIARWDHTQLPCDVEWAMYNQMRAAYCIDRLVFVPALLNLHGVEEYETMEEALAVCEGQRVFLEPTGAKTIADIPTGDIVVVLGNTGESNLSYAAEGETYRIETHDRFGHLYGINAAAIALYEGYVSGTRG